MSYYADPNAQYGSTQGYQGYAPQPTFSDDRFPQKRFAVRSFNRRTNLPAICMSLFVPWILFVALFSCMSFKMHYDSASVCYLINVLALVVVIGFGVISLSAARRRSFGDEMADPTWFAFLFVTGLIAWFCAVTLGGLNFVKNMRPYYDVTNLNTYQSVDPSTMRGNQVMDAGRIVFANEAHLDFSKTMGFQNFDTYCVAPIVGANMSETYDFWAIGVNCCSGGSSMTFSCGEFSNPAAKSGLRLMKDDDRSFYRLAVQQAVAAYNINANHPVFFLWMQDPDTEMNAYEDEGNKYFLLGIFVYFAFQLFATIVAVLLFSKM